MCFYGCRTVSSGISGASYYTGTFNTVNRSPAGDYVAVSSRGNFFLTWEPGQVTEMLRSLFEYYSFLIHAEKYDLDICLGDSLLCT